jgi:hypothetical protein
MSKNSTFEKQWKYCEYMKMRSEAEKNGDESFVYQNITYAQTWTPSAWTPTGVVIYVRQQNQSF